MKILSKNFKKFINRIYKLKLSSNKTTLNTYTDFILHYKNNKLYLYNTGYCSYNDYNLGYITINDTKKDILNISEISIIDNEIFDNLEKNGYQDFIIEINASFKKLINKLAKYNEYIEINDLISKKQSFINIDNTNMTNTDIDDTDIENINIENINIENINIENINNINIYNSINNIRKSLEKTVNIAYKSVKHCFRMKTAFTHIVLNKVDGKINLNYTNGSILYRKTLENINYNYVNVNHIFLPIDYLRKIFNFLPKKESISLFVYNDIIIIKSDNHTFTFKNINEDYLNVNSVIPNNKDIEDIKYVCLPNSNFKVLDCFLDNYKKTDKDIYHKLYMGVGFLTDGKSQVSTNSNGNIINSADGFYLSLFREIFINGFIQYGNVIKSENKENRELFLIAIMKMDDDDMIKFGKISSNFHDNTDFDSIDKLEKYLLKLKIYIKKQNKEDFELKTIIRNFLSPDIFYKGYEIIQDKLYLKIINNNITLPVYVGKIIENENDIILYNDDSKLLEVNGYI